MERGEIFMGQKLKQVNDISIGDNLHKLRNAANLTQEQVVAQLQLRNLPTSRSVYSQIEAGTYNIRISVLSRKLNDALSSRLFYAHFDSHRDISHFKNSCFCELFF